MMYAKIPVFKHLENIELTSGTNAKRDYIASLISDPETKERLIQVFTAALDPYVTYNIVNFKKLRSSEKLVVSANDDEVLDRFLQVTLPALSSRSVTGNAALQLVNSELSNMTPLQEKWCARIILKNLRLGISTSTVDKIFPALVKKFSVALAETLNSKFNVSSGTFELLDRVDYPTWVEPKLDGFRLIAVKDKGEVKLLTRNGTVVTTLPHVVAELESMQIDSVVFDGEIMGEDWNETASLVMSHVNKKDSTRTVYYVFDVLPLKEWSSMRTDTPQAVRRKTLEELFINSERFTSLSLVTGEMVSNDNELSLLVKKHLNAGHEGVMVKDPRSPYIFKRSSSLLKLKPTATFEGIIVNVYTGKRGTKRENSFSGFELLLTSGAITKVATGFSDALREEIESMPKSSWIGKIAEIEAQPDPSTRDGLTVDGRARFPTFVRFRHHSDVESQLAELAMTLKDAFDEREGHEEYFGSLLEELSGELQHIRSEREYSR